MLLLQISFLAATGDNGQKDAEIYVDLAKRYSERILGILIRDVVSNNPLRQLEPKALATEITSTHNSQFLYSTRCRKRSPTQFSKVGS